ncbi:MAG: hypothetical protein M3245_01265 [Actinomycetota bacterium]|nr:hypothetical protein [Actinomycetota bacterium]
MNSHPEGADDWPETGTFTPASGAFEDRMDPGVHIIWFEKRGYLRVERRVEVPPNTVLELLITLKRDPAFADATPGP